MNVHFRFPGLQLPFGPHCSARVGDVELPGPLVLAHLALLVAQVELVHVAAGTWRRRPLARVTIRPYLPARPRRRLVGADGRKLRGLSAVIAYRSGRGGASSRSCRDTNRTRRRQLEAREPDYRGEVDHAALIASLVAGGYAGWALSTSAKALRDVLPLCPPTARVCAWVKPHGASPLTYGLHNCWEPVIVVPGRQRRPGRRDWLSALPARGGGELPGRKPIAFCSWLFQLLGMRPGDALDDLFPGSGVVTAAWRELSRQVLGDVALGHPRRVAQSDRDASFVDPETVGPGRRVVVRSHDDGRGVRA